MSKKQKQREQSLQHLGKDLARRSKSCCELCLENTSLYAFEIPPLEEEPTIERSLFLCDFCTKRMQVMLSTPKKTVQKRTKDDQEGLFVSKDLLFLQERVWSDIPVVQVSAVLVSYKAKHLGFGWAIEMLDGLYLGEEVSNWVDELLTTIRL